jgi:hypothetical protein
VNDEREKPKALLCTGRIWGLIAISAVGGFLIGMVFFKEPWDLPPAWGDVPTWLLVGLAAAAGWIGFVQLAILRQQITDEIDRNKKRDELLDKQLDEAERRAKSERRQLVEGVEVKFTGKTGDVVNNSKRPINDITCKIMSKVDRVSLALPTSTAEVIGDGMGPAFLLEPKPVSRFETLQPGATCSFTFDDLTETPDQVLVAWFTDDDEFRWQLDQHQRLVQADDESEYKPVRAPRPLPQRALDAVQ